ncbi:polyketide cyclase/dehydrase and lipid transport [Leptospira fainei serovar Hurstbridge str. BUT 6]|uniref:Polyketide cyclase/dehydrase and lipid transport n=1 Tax=Leptospira fainei serovar Hurstbridge str. BUT 6 TaxID=1193011 RepID=S3UTP8_9LEPT|nr:SRPBCC family protein [Leptospira fainei]EPG72623.1 polyketide cyclase/dehydrase and lipid transport [Leptospira fainei serovar Hurstbridge str. BUT 6]
MSKLKQILKVGAAIIVVLIIAVLLLAANKSNTLRVERSIEIKAPPEKIFVLINNLQSWRSWSPYEKLDPAMKRTLTGPISGKGAIYEWNGNSNIGKGRMEIIESTEPSKVGIKLDFLEPFEAHNTAEFTLKSGGDSTKVTWMMSGPASFFSRILGVFIDMDTMIGKNFEEGLENLKRIMEK